MLVPVQKHKETLTVLSKVQISLINVHGFWMFSCSAALNGTHILATTRDLCNQKLFIWLSLQKETLPNCLFFPKHSTGWDYTFLKCLQNNFRVYLHFHNLSVIFIYYIFHGLTEASLSPAGLFPNPRGRPGWWSWKADKCLGFLYSSVPSRQENPSPPASSELWSTWGPIVWTR